MDTKDGALKAMFAKLQGSPVGLNAGKEFKNILKTPMMKYAQKNPLASAGIGALGLGNLSGLTDNPNFLGQLLGGGAGAGAGALAGLGTPGLLASGLGGGVLGSLIDKLIADKNAKAQMMPGQEQMY